MLQFTKCELKILADTVTKMLEIHTSKHTYYAEATIKVLKQNNKSSDDILLKEWQNAFVQIVFFTIVNLGISTNSYM